MAAPGEAAVTVPLAPCATGDTTVGFPGSFVISCVPTAGTVVPATSDADLGDADGADFSTDELEALPPDDDFGVSLLRGVPFPRCRCCRRIPT